MGTVPTGPLAALYSNTTPGIVADPAVVDAAIQIIVQTINDNWSSFQSFIQAPTLGVADGAIPSSKLRDGAVTKTKIVKEAVTQFTYDFMQIDQKIAELVVGDIPQSVIDAIAAEASARADVVQEHLDEHEVEFRKHEADYIRQPAFSITSGTSTEYLVALNPAPTEIPEGFGITIVPHEQNGANPTLTIGNLTAIPLKDQKGNNLAAGKLLAGKPYSFRKVGADFLADSGSGAEGNATANDLRAGKTATVESGELITGTLVERSTTNINPNTSVQNFPAGIYGAFTVSAVKRLTSSANVPAYSSSTVNTPFQANLAYVGRSGFSTDAASATSGFSGFADGRMDADASSGFTVSIGSNNITISSNYSSSTSPNYFIYGV